MKKSFICLVLSFLIINLFAGIIITRDEQGMISRELYHNNYFAEIENDLIVSIWNFNDLTLTLINHPLRIYTTIDFESFKNEMIKQNQAQINAELRNLDKERQKLYADATVTLFKSMRPRFMIVDTTNIQGYKAYEYHIYNGDIKAQKLWISRDLQNDINDEVNPINIKKIESVFKTNRQTYFDAMGIFLDPVSSLVESIEDIGYVVKRNDYGFREKSDKEYEDEVDKVKNEISEIKKSNIDPQIFTKHQKYQQLDYNSYQVAVIKAMEKQLKR
ncbi:MAG: hypothetical protein M0Q94_05170 [Candidatus Cloacimonetes bacterium]|jgi:hypothetical protein|nr:hypothetical protein [Candidatus Cloacimonadota bacterium]